MDYRVGPRPDALAVLEVVLVLAVVLAPVWPRVHSAGRVQRSGSRIQGSRFRV